MKLHECALHTPGQNPSKDLEIDVLENELLALQEDILEQAAILKIETVQDFKTVSNVWRLASEFEFKTELNSVERITRSLHSYAKLKA